MKVFVVLYFKPSSFLSFHFLCSHSERMAHFHFIIIPRNITSTGLQASKCELNFKGMVLVQLLGNQTGFPIAMKRYLSALHFQLIQFCILILFPFIHTISSQICHRFILYCSKIGPCSPKVALDQFCSNCEFSE